MYTGHLIDNVYWTMICTIQFRVILKDYLARVGVALEVLHCCCKRV